MLAALKPTRLVPLLVFVLAVTLVPQIAWSDDAAKKESDDPIVAGQKKLNTATDAGDVEGIKAARAIFEKALGDEKIAPVAHYFVGYADSCAAGIQQHQAPEEGAKLMKSAVKHLEKAVELDEKNADALAMLGSCYGQMIGTMPERMMELGPKSQDCLLRAMDLEPKNPRVVLLSGVSTLWTPEQFGGGAQLALPTLEKATKLFDGHESKDPHEPTWGHDQAYGWLAFAYNNTGRKDEAKKALDKALKLNPKSGFLVFFIKPAVTGGGEDAKEPETGSGGKADG